jgi:hypothetical protein
VPFKSRAQQRFAYANPSKFGGASGLKEWSNATNFSELPEKKKKKDDPPMKKPLTEAASHIKHPGATRRAAHRAGESTREWAEQHKHDSDPKKRARATLALGFMNSKH